MLCTFSACGAHQRAGAWALTQTETELPSDSPWGDCWWSGQHQNVSSAPEETAIGSNAASGKQPTDSHTNKIHHQRSATETINISELASENCQSGAQARKAAKCGSVSVGKKQQWQRTVRKQNRNAKYRKQDQSGPRKAEQSGHRTCPPPHPRPRAILGT